MFAGGDRDVAADVKSASGNSLDSTTDSGNAQGRTSPDAGDVATTNTSTGTGKTFSDQPTVNSATRNINCSGLPGLQADCAKSSSISAGGDRDVAANVKSAGGNSLQTTDSGNQQGATSPGGTGKAFSVQCSSASDSSQCELRLSVSKSKAHDVGVLS